MAEPFSLPASGLAKFILDQAKGTSSILVSRIVVSSCQKLRMGLL